MGRLNPQDDRGGKPETPSPLQLMGLGFELVAPLLAGLFGGRWLDGRLGTGPWLVLVGAVTGAVAGMWNFYRRVAPPGDTRRGGSA
jgi:F0F1-type ATP synthase assembly protein I